VKCAASLFHQHACQDGRRVVGSKFLGRACVCVVMTTTTTKVCVRVWISHHFPSDSPPLLRQSRVGVGAPERKRLDFILFCFCQGRKKTLFRPPLHAWSRSRKQSCFFFLGHTAAVEGRVWGTWDLALHDGGVGMFQCVDLKRGMRGTRGTIIVERCRSCEMREGWQVAKLFNQVSQYMPGRS
jgi:hypothetical protein